MTPDELRAEKYERPQARLEEIRKICAAAIGAEGRSIELAYKIRRVLQTTTGEHRMTNRPVAELVAEQLPQMPEVSA
jgi:hypothetical protein